MSFLLLKAMKATRPAVWPVLAELGLHPGQDLLLSNLWREDGISQSELIARLGVEPPTVSKALHRLEGAGYVRREPANGRGRIVHLTDAGRALQEPVERAWRQADADVLGGLDESERTTLRDLLTRVART